MTAAVVVTVAAVTGALVATAGGAPAAEVTVRVERFFDRVCNCYKLRFSGTIASGAANEYVAVLRQRCGSNFSTSFAGASTREGGLWEAEGPGGHPDYDSATYRARWNGRFSEPLTFRAKVPISIGNLGGNRYRVAVTTADTGQRMSGRVVELQRLASGQWTGIRRARLRVQGGRASRSFFAVFTVPARGLTLRAFVPGPSASPCYVATPSESWISGRDTAVAGARVADRTYSCTNGVKAGVRFMSVSAKSGYRQDGVWKAYATAGVSNSGGFATEDYRWGAGLLAAEGLFPEGPGGNNPGVSISTGSEQPGCVASRSHVPLSSRGLSGGGADAFGDYWKCDVPSKVLVRIRGVYRAPTSFVSERTPGTSVDVDRAAGLMREGFLSVRTLTGKPLVFAHVSESGKTRVFVASSCVAT